MKVISIFNQKGGVGKTTSVVNISSALAKLGKKVLVIDFDPQANTTTGLGLDKKTIEKSIYDLFYMDEKEDVFEYIVETKEKVSLISSEASLSGLEVELVELDQEERSKQLKYIIEMLNESFDLVIIDCPPSLGLLSINALVASDSIIIPIQTEYYALEGVSELLNTYRLVKESLNPNLEIEGVLLCMFDKRTNLSYEVVDEVKAYFKSKVFRTMIPRNIKLAEAPSFGKSAIYYDKSSMGAKAYTALAKELLESLEKYESDRKKEDEKDSNKKEVLEAKSEKKLKKTNEKQEVEEKEDEND